MYLDKHILEINSWHLQNFPAQDFSEFLSYVTQSFIKLPCLRFLMCRRKFVKVIVCILVISINK